MSTNPAVLFTLIALAGTLVSLVIIAVFDLIERLTGGKP